MAPSCVTRIPTFRLELDLQDSTEVGCVLVFLTPAVLFSSTDGEGEHPSGELAPVFLFFSILLMWPHLQSVLSQQEFAKRCKAQCFFWFISSTASPSCGKEFIVAQQDSGDTVKWQKNPSSFK